MARKKERDIAAFELLNALHGLYDVLPGSVDFVPFYHLVMRRTSLAESANERLAQVVATTDRLYEALVAANRLPSTGESGPSAEYLLIAVGAGVASSRNGEAVTRYRGFAGCRWKGGAMREG